MQILKYTNRFFMLIFLITILIHNTVLIPDLDSFLFLLAFFLGAFQVSTAVIMFIYYLFRRNKGDERIQAYLFFVVLYFVALSVFTEEYFAIKRNNLVLIFSIMAVILSFYFTYIVEKIKVNI